MGKNKHFIKEFFKEKKTVGAVKPSSKALGKKMLSPINFSNIQAIAEYGPGTGVFTKMIVDQMDKDTVLLVFELHEAFFKKLEKQYSNHSNVHIINDSAENIRKYLDKYKIDHLDAIVSSLPLTNFNNTLTSRILKRAHQSLKEGGIYVQFQYTLNARKILKRIFHGIRINFTPNNLPPAFVYTCVKK